MKEGSENYSSTSHASSLGEDKKGFIHAKPPVSSSSIFFEGVITACRTWNYPIKAEMHQDQG